MSTKSKKAKLEIIEDKHGRYMIVWVCWDDAFDGWEEGADAADLSEECPYQDLDAEIAAAAASSDKDKRESLEFFVVKRAIVEGEPRSNVIRFANIGEARVALRRANVALKELRQRWSKVTAAWPAWALRAKAEGWKPPKGWKPKAD